MSTPKLALCIPAYNAAEFLPRLLRSAMSQTIPFDEIWVYDDCSTDETGKVALGFGAQVMRGEINRGCSFGKNALAEQTSCEWIHFHDADDELYPNFVETARNWMRDDGPDVVLFAYEWIDEETKNLLWTRYYDGEQIQRDPIGYAIREQIQSICGIYRRSRFLSGGGYDLDPLVLYNEDVAMHCQLARAGLSFAADPTITVINYRRRNSMSSANLVKCCRAQFHVMRKAAEATGKRYAADIADRLWEIASASSTFLDWENADACVTLAASLDGRRPKNASSLFSSLCLLSPRLALRVRERLIRLLKPHLREGINAS